MSYITTYSDANIFCWVFPGKFLKYGKMLLLTLYKRASERNTHIRIRYLKKSHARAEKLCIRQTLKMYKDNDSKREARKTPIWLLLDYPNLRETPHTVDCNMITKTIDFATFDTTIHTTSRKLGASGIQFFVLYCILSTI